MNDGYYDRRGNLFTPKLGANFRERKGVWLILHHKNSILLCYPNYAQDVPELPGGGIDKGETLIDAALRELCEETELNPTSISIKKEHEQFVHFYAEYDSEYWNYEQNFLLITEDLEKLYFTEKRKVAEGYCEWIKVNDLTKHQIHYMHQKALKALDLIN